MTGSEHYADMISAILRGRCYLISPFTQARISNSGIVLFEDGSLILA